MRARAMYTRKGSPGLSDAGSGMAPTTAWRARLDVARLDGGWPDPVQWRLAKARGKRDRGERKEKKKEKEGERRKKKERKKEKGKEKRVFEFPKPEYIPFSDF